MLTYNAKKTIFKCKVEEENIIDILLDKSELVIITALQTTMTYSQYSSHLVWKTQIFTYKNAPTFLLSI